MLGLGLPGVHPAWRLSQVGPCGLWSPREPVGGLGCHNLGDKGFLRGPTHVCMRVCTHTHSSLFFFFFKRLGTTRAPQL